MVRHMKLCVLLPAVVVSLAGASAVLAGGVRGLPAAQTATSGGYYSAYQPAYQAGYQPVQAGYPVTAGYAPAVAVPSTHAANVGYYAYRPAYMPTYAARPAYAVARPVYPAQTAYYAPAPSGYGPAMTYGAPAYQAGGAPPRAATTAYYAPTAAYAMPGYSGYSSVQPTVAYSNPTAGSYTVAPQGMGNYGASTYANYGQPYRVNYVPPTFTYRPNYAQIPVTYYRPVVAYQPGTGTPVTCQQATVGTECQAQPRRGWFDWLHPRRCGTAPAPVAVPTTAYCGTATCGSTGCGTAQPYYQPAPVVPVVPYVPPTGATVVQPAQPRVIAVPQNTTPFPSNVPPYGSGTTVPSPPTRFNPGTTFPGATAPGTTVPADTQPRLDPGTLRQPGSTIFPAPSGYPPVNDPYSGYQSPTTTRGDASGTTSSSVFGSGYPSTSSSNRASVGSTQRPERTGLGGASGPSLGSPHSNASDASQFPSNIQPVPDPDATSRPRATNRAPQLLDPRDKTALVGDQRWAVVPAVWAKKSGDRNDAQNTGLQPIVAEPANTSPYIDRAAATEPVSAVEWDDSGWKSAR